MSLHPIADKAEVSVDFPDKAYMGSFSRHSQFDAYADEDSVAVRLVRPGEDRREAVMHLHYGLLADILVELAKSLASRPAELLCGLVQLGSVPLVEFRTLQQGPPSF